MFPLFPSQVSSLKQKPLLIKLICAKTSEKKGTIVPLGCPRNGESYFNRSLPSKEPLPVELICKKRPAERYIFCRWSHTLLIEGHAPY